MGLVNREKTSAAVVRDLQLKNLTSVLRAAALRSP
jgi:hypothetical protein